MSLKNGTDLSALNVAAAAMYVLPARQVAQSVKTMKKLVLSRKEKTKIRERGGLL